LRANSGCSLRRWPFLCTVSQMEGKVVLICEASTGSQEKGHLGLPGPAGGDSTTSKTLRGVEKRPSHTLRLGKRQTSNFTHGASWPPACPDPTWLDAFSDILTTHEQAEQPSVISHPSHLWSRIAMCQPILSAAAAAEDPAPDTPILMAC
jgi:hypothetical protein